MHHDFNCLSLELRFIALLDAVFSCLLGLELNVAESTRLSVWEGLEFQRLDLTVLGEVFAKLLLSEFSTKIAANDIGLVIEALLNETHINGAAINLSVIHFLLAPVGFFLRDKLQEAKPVGALGDTVL
jgi:hypothetical protein